MSQILFDRYKDALRRGHLAAQQGRLDLAIEAYREATDVAPDRALPHATLGSLYRRLGRSVEAEAAFGAALDRSPGDETALRGRAELRAEQGRRTESAEDHAALAGVLERADRLVDACTAARQSLELAESGARRRTVERLVGRLDALESDPLAAQAARLARQLLGPAGHGRPGDPEGPTASAPTGPATLLQPPLDPAARLAEAQALIDAGEVVPARRVLLELAVGSRAAGHREAAFDVGFQLLQLDSSDVAAHMELATNQFECGWTGIAEQKLRLLARLAELDGNVSAIAAIAGFGADRGLAFDVGGTGLPD